MLSNTPPQHKTSEVLLILAAIFITVLAGIVAWFFHGFLQSYREELHAVLFGASTTIIIASTVAVVIVLGISISMLRTGLQKQQVELHHHDNALEIDNRIKAAQFMTYVDDNGIRRPVIEKV